MEAQVRRGSPDRAETAGQEAFGRTALARVWQASDDELMAIELTNQPLAPFLERLAQELAIKIDTTRLAPTPTITANAKGLPLRHLLGLALYKAGCRCKLEGDKLVILSGNP
jgi:hypothetical protein